MAIAIGSSGDGPAYGAFNGDGTSGTNTTGNANFDTVLNGFDYGNGPRTITLNNLIPGQKYAVQLFALDDRSNYGANIPLRPLTTKIPLIRPIFQPRSRWVLMSL